ncbi:hypothetical protein GCM10009554_44680 [Kribbella koreensis]|uniref:Secreted protein n=1 Tax=Kribbella koreensis TaxID=57909 RepID=A0ABP4B942_9ACTN
MNIRRGILLAVAGLCTASAFVGGSAVATAQAPTTVSATTHFETYGAEGVSAWGEVTVPSGDKARVQGWIRDDKCDRRNAAVKVTFDYPLVGTDKTKYFVNNTDGKCGPDRLKSFDTAQATANLQNIYITEYTDNWWSSETWGAKVKVWSH